MVLNGLGFIGQRLYLFPDFFKNISTKRLFGDGVTREDLNQYAIGETLDRIVKYGPTKLFILASNDISLSPEEMLKYYKGQDSVEKGFRFLKSDTFSV
jgi:transposase